MAAQEITGLPTSPVPVGAPSPPPPLPRPEVPPPPPPAREPAPENGGGEAAAPVPDRKQLEETVRSMNRVLRGINSRLDFDLYDGTDALFVRLVDRKTNKVLRTMPPEAMLKVRSKIAEAVGSILDETV